MTSTVGIAIYGCAHIHMTDVARILAGREEVDCLGVWDADTSRMEAWAGRLGARPVDGLLAFARRPDVAAVLILSETHLHEPLVTATASAGKPLFVEKPLATTGEVARRLAERIGGSAGGFHTGYFLRDVPVHRTLKTMIRGGRLGTIVRARAQLSHDGALRGVFDDHPWHVDAAQAGYGGFGDLGIHLVDLLTWLLDERVEAVRASVGTTGATPAPDEYGEGTLRFPGGARAELTAGWTERQGPVSLAVTGTRGTALVVDGRLQVEGEAAGAPSLPDPVAPSAGTAVVRFLDRVTDRATPDEIPADEAASHCEVIDALYASARESRWVDV